jgi:chromosome segregation ATPase
MKLPFKTDPAVARDKARAELATAEIRLEQLAGQRAAALAGAEASIPDIRKLDQEAEEARATGALLHERIRKLNAAVRKDELERLERARDAAVAKVIEPQLLAIKKLGVDLEQAVSMLSESYSALIAATESLNATWPSAVPRPAFWSGAFSLLDIASRLQTAARYLGDRPGRKVCAVDHA